jgi:ABC-type phosphate transport system permease subunit
VIAIALTIAAAVWVGITTEHRYGARAVRWSKLALSGIIYGAVPVIVFFNVARLRFDVDVAGGLALAWLNLAVGWHSSSRRDCSRSTGRRPVR